MRHEDTHARNVRLHWRRGVLLKEYQARRCSPKFKRDLDCLP